MATPPKTTYKKKLRGGAVIEIDTQIRSWRKLRKEENLVLGKHTELAKRMNERPRRSVAKARSKKALRGYFE